MVFGNTRLILYRGTYAESGEKNIYKQIEYPGLLKRDDLARNDLKIIKIDRKKLLSVEREKCFYAASFYSQNTLCL